MSYIFSGIKLKHRLVDKISQPISTETEKIKAKVKYLQAIGCFTFKKGDKSNNLLKCLFEGEGSWDEEDEVLWTDTEVFLQNSCKIDYLKNISDRVPKILYFFRPIYATQLAIRFAVKQISGATDEQEISHIIQKNNDILGFFLHFYKICTEVYTGKWLLEPFKEQKKFKEGLFLAIIEIQNLLRNDTPDLIRISTKQLREWGDNSITIGKSTSPQSGVLKIIRGEVFDIDMYTVDRVCLTCSQHFETLQSLNSHINSHDKYICQVCRIQVNTYEELACHHLTFCRAKLWNNKCLYCKSTKTQCNCIKIMSLTLEILLNFTASKSNNNIFASDMLSTIIHHFNNTIRREENINEEEVFEDIMQNTQMEDETQINIDNKRGEIEKYVSSSLPDFTINNNKVVSNLFVQIEWKDIKQILEPIFDSYHEAEINILKKLASIRTKCTQTSCTSNFNFNIKHHLETHSICPLTRTLKAEEVPIRFNSYHKFVAHSREHTLDCDIERQLLCTYCDKILGNEEGLNLGSFLTHIDSHKNESGLEDNQCKNSELIDCKTIKFDSAVELFVHKLLWHITNEADLTLQIRDLAYEPDSTPNKQLCKTTLKTHKNWSLIKHLDFSQQQDQDSSSNDDDTSSEGENRIRDKDKKEVNRKEGVKKSKEVYCCENEKHEKPVVFTTKVALKRHIIENHTCPYKGCNYSNMFEKTLLQHFEIHLLDDMEAKCNICNKVVKELDSHLREHPKCKSCQARFEDLAILRAHEPTCTKINQELKGKIEKWPSNSIETSSLNVDTTELESKFSGLIQRLLKDSNLTEAEKMMGSQIIEKYTSCNTIAKNRSRIDAINNRRNDALLFDIPSFIHTDKPQLHKVLSSIGDIKEEEKFNPSIQNSNQKCVVNFEAFELLLKKIENLILLGNLTELLTVALLQKFIGQAVIDAVCSYQQKNWEDLSFQAILESIQWIYIPLKLTIFQTYVLSYTHDKNIENFLEFASKVYRHLKLCSRLKAKEDRPIYIEQNLRKILKRNLPLKLLDAIEAKESLYTAFTSKEILDHYVSYIHNQTEGRVDHSKYNVFALKVRTQPATVRTKGKRDTKKFSPTNKASPKTNGKVPYQQGDKKKIFEIKNQGKKTPKPSEASQKKIDKLKKFGIDTTYPLCFLCLKKHPFFKCTQYKGVKMSEELCIKNNKPMGFHEVCKHNETNFGKTNVKIWKPRNN